MKNFIHSIKIAMFGILLHFNLFSQDYKGLYVDQFHQIVGNINKEDSLLNYAKANGFNALTFYNLHQIDLSDGSNVLKLKNFISKAKLNYGIEEFSATAENFWFFENKILPFNQQVNNDEKFTCLNLEFEFWVPESVSNYYCTTYLQPNGYTCDEEGAFQFYMNELNSIYNLAQNNQLKTEIYLGWFNQNQADQVKTKCDRILLSNYHQDPNFCFDYSLQRLQYLGNSTPSIEVATLFSGENSFLNPWLTTNNYNLDACFTNFSNEYANENGLWKNNIQLIGQQWFTYTQLPYYLPEEQSNKIDEKNDEHFYFTNPVENYCILSSSFDLKTELHLFDYSGQEITIEKNNENVLNLKNLNSGLYFLEYKQNKFKLIKL
ncbi:MAG: T9SS type A sorting domain-containing protein [Flavobacteriia bacterium]|nr:T9SS type A sorting domain-containing protein [Flavobacteriia bacterium]